ncbi:hypothetical protein TSUD_164020 [Trifolium subterraneum]|uniref:Uncharacterized protein n=1 Tax=Trifolium subterraneum TaxID=3900 RepID=A0A2Z6M168_TRISU|nr:hypothetical protein TSUD_164020 [Trifolium subterraneum]
MLGELETYIMQSLRICDKDSNQTVLYLIVTLIALPRYICNPKVNIGHKEQPKKCGVRALRGN